MPESEQTCSLDRLSRHALRGFSLVNFRIALLGIKLLRTFRIGPRRETSYPQRDESGAVPRWHRIMSFVRPHHDFFCFALTFAHLAL
jgi:hypothetical protein